MGRVNHFHADVVCPRWVRTGETKQFETEDCKQPEHITEEQLEALPEHIAQTYDMCSGVVPVKGYDDPGRLYGDPYDCYPPESECEVGDCDVFPDKSIWTKEELDVFESIARKDTSDADEPPECNEDW